MSLVQDLKILKQGILYFPIRFMLCAFLFSYVLIKNDSILLNAEKQILAGMMQFFRLPAYFSTGHLYIGHFNAPTELFPPIDTQILFLIFFLSLAVVTRGTLSARMKILSFGGLFLLISVVSEFLMIVPMISFGVKSSVSFVQVGIIATGIIGALTIESLLFSVITLPVATKTRIIIKRSYVDEYIFLAILLFSAGVIIYIMFNLLQVNADSPAATYVALNISNILALKYYIAYFLYETKLPGWIKWFKQPQGKGDAHMAATFLLPAYNEERGIRKCIESIDIAAKQYPGRTEIVVVNDGSTDNTAKISEVAIGNLKNCTGKLYSIPNSGKGYALQHGLERVTGDIIFRIDTDSVVEKNAIQPVMNHFKDPTVGSVSGMIFPVEEKSLWQKAMVMLGCLFVFYRRGQELIDSILVQPGAFSIFRKDALLKVGGWAHNQFGEDGELTIRLGRFGYKNEFEQNAVVLSEAPKNIKELRDQRIRWGIAFYHSRGRNSLILKESSAPRTVIYLLNLLSHGGGFALSMFWPFLIAGIIAGTQHYSISNISALLGVPLKLIFVEILIFGLQYVLYIYFLRKFKKSYLIKYLPLMRAYDLFLSIFIKPEAMEILIVWSSKYKELTKDSYKILGRMAKKMNN